MPKESRDLGRKGHGNSLESGSRDEYLIIGMLGYDSKLFSHYLPETAESAPKKCDQMQKAVS
jgi:hypothetical protein